MNKVALIIGNAAYPDDPLKNPVNDAQDMEERLKRLGFFTLTRRDATNIVMDEALTEFSARLATSDVALFFFAGHGMQIDGRNYLTAVDTNFKREVDAKFSSLALDKVIETMEKGANQTDIIILDACRTNPYERRWRGVESRGLAPVYAPKGMIVAYATSPGQVAYDGEGRNGAYTDAFLKHVSTPDITVEELFKRVRNTLSSITRGRQISWEHTSLMGDFFFNFSIVTEELVAEYGENAIADSNFHCKSGKTIQGIINSLKSHNWYKQNPAIVKLSGSDITTFNKDELFVLGRNIYQAACGKAGEAMAFLENLGKRLSQYGENYHFHVLNGILFEIYFDSTGRFRKYLKSDRIDPVFQLEDVDPFNKSFNWIRQILGPYMKNLFYIPSTAKGTIVDVSCIDYEDDVKAIDAIFYEGDNVLYNDDGTEYFDPYKDDYLRNKTREKFIKNLSEAMGIPSYRLKIVFTNLDNAVEDILVPYSLNVKRLAS